MKPTHTAKDEPCFDLSAIEVPQSIQAFTGQAGGAAWLDCLGPGQRLALRGAGQHLLALLVQFASRAGGGELFMEEGKRLAGEYACVCAQAGFSLTETVQIFQFFSRSILESIHQTSGLDGGEDLEGRRLFCRASDFLDQILLSLIGNFLQSHPLSKKDTSHAADTPA